MKKIFWKFFVLLCLTSFSLYGVQWNDLKDGESAEKTLDGNGKVTTVNKLRLGKNSHLKVKGKNTKGIVIKGGLSAEVNIGEGATLDVDIENSTKDEAGISLESTFKGFTIQKNGNLKLKKQFNGTINSGDIFKQFLDRKGEGTLLRGVSVIKTFSTEGSTRIESAGTGIGFDRKTPQGKGLIEFKKGSKTFVKAGFAGVFARYNSVTFEEGSDTTLIGGAYGIMVNKGTIKKGAKVTLMGNYGTGKFEVKEHDFLKFESGSELNILANDSALYGIRLKGKTKLIAKGYNVLRQIDTYADGEHSLDTVTFERGSILDGNIDRSWNSQILLEEGTKLFVPNKIQANLEIKGDLFVGPRSAYEGKQKTYKEAVEDVDTVAGATAIFMGKQAQKARKGEFSYRGLYNEFSPDEYYTLEYNRDNHYNYKSTLNLNNGKINLRLGDKDRFGRINDKIIFSKNTIIKGKGELVFHKRNSSQVTKNTVFNILEEEGLKDINGTQGYYLEKLPLKIPDVSFGKLVFTTKVKKLNGRYVVSLVFKGIEADNFLLAKGETKTLDKKKEGSLEDAILSAKEVTVEEKSTLNIKGDTNGLFAKNKVTVEEEANLNIETKKDNKIGLKLEENLETFGNINIKNAGTGILADSTTSVLQFENGSKTIVNAKDIAVNAQKGTSEFKGGSNVELTSNKYALVAKKAVFEKGSTVKLNGEYGIGTLSETDSSDITFKSQSEVNINSSNSGIYNVNVGGSGKISIKAPNVLKQVRTVNQSLKFENGSILEGNIEKSWNANLILDKGSKMFVNNKIEANMDIKGDLFVGTRNSYEKEEGKRTIQTLSAISASSPSDKYYTVHYNKDSNGNKTKVNLDNANIHLRINGAQSENNDKMVFSKDTEIRGKGEITLHPQNVSKVKRNMSFTLLEEEGKDVGGNKVYDLEKLPLTLGKAEFGALKFGRKDKKLNGRYVVTLVATGELSEAAKNTLINSRDSYKYNQEELKSISDKIFEKHNLELKNNFWLLVSKENLKNKDGVTKLNQNSRYAGYDYTFNTGVSLGFFVGESTGKHKNIAQGIYLKKDLKPFYLGAIYKHTNSKDKKNDKKFYSNDFSFIAGYNKELGEKVFVDSNVKLTRGYTSSYDYIAENNLNTKNEKANYLNGEVNTKLGYKFKHGNAFLKAGLDKDLKGNQKVVWNENIDEKIKYDDFSKNIGLGMEYKLGNHSFNLELSKKYSKHYRKNTKITFGYSYKF
uniref:autotransporter n=1 Tax=Fusobacterium nucleatum TaxID=851 RepID=UPI003564297E